MADLIVPGVTEEVHKLLSERAAENGRTLNGEVLVVLERASTGTGPIVPGQRPRRFARSAKA